MANSDYYETLGVSRDASEEEIRKAFRKRAKELHPDRNRDDPTASDKFKKINEAYEVLRDQQKRAAYDRFGHDSFTSANMGAAGGGGFGARPGAGGGADFASAFADVFDDLFGEFAGGGQRSRQQSHRGEDMRFNLSVTLEEAYRGKQETINVMGSVACDACKGSGAKDGSAASQCPTCSGLGRVRVQQGFFAIERTCPTCNGAGSTIKDPCQSCAGAGRVRKERSLTVNIPPGVDDGSRIRLAGEGEAGTQGGSPGDLYLFVEVKPHTIFKRDGPDLHYHIPVPMTTAALGGTIEAPTIDGGRSRVNVPAGSQNGRRMRLRDKGMPSLRNPKQFGDLYLELQVETPVNLNARQKELLQEFTEEDVNNSPNSESFFDKVRRFWDGMTH